MRAPALLALPVPLALCAALWAGCEPAPWPPRAPAIEIPSAAPPPASAAPAGEHEATGWRGAEHVKLDGFQLGSLYGSAVMSRAPYDKPCDDDPVDGRARRFMVYGALPCRELVFPEETTVAFYLRFAEGAGELEQPIEAVAWLGGSYFSSRSDFPVRIGEPAARASEVLGAAETTFHVDRKGQVVLVQKHRGNAWAIVDAGMLVGFVLGPMPDDPDNEQWRGLMQMYVRYTKPPAR
jgi:hypothetical protein